METGPASNGSLSDLSGFGLRYANTRLPLKRLQQVMHSKSTILESEMFLDKRKSLRPTAQHGMKSSRFATASTLLISQNRLRKMPFERLGTNKGNRDFVNQTADISCGGLNECNTRTM